MENFIKGPWGHYTLFEAYSTYLEACFPFEENFWGKDTLFNPFSHIWRHISPFKVFRGKDTLFEVFSTYLEASSLHEKMPCDIVDMIKPSKERCFVYGGDKWHCGPILFTQKAKGSAL
jgi:hypothetical protein